MLGLPNYKIVENRILTKCELMKVKVVPSEWFEFPKRSDVFKRESPVFMQILDLEASSVQRICTLSLIICKPRES